MRRPDKTTQVQRRMPLSRFKYPQACAVFFLTAKYFCFKYILSAILLVASFISFAIIYVPNILFFFFNLKHKG